jgi:hypothetical protein
VKTKTIIVSLPIPIGRKGQTVTVDFAVNYYPDKIDPLSGSPTWDTSAVDPHGEFANPTTCDAWAYIDDFANNDVVLKAFGDAVAKDYEREVAAMTTPATPQPPRIHRMAFQPMFWDAIRSGVKTSTIRPPRKRPICVGDYIQPYGWTGLPYRSKTVLIFRPVKVTASWCMSISLSGVSVNGDDDDLVLLNHFTLTELAVREGFGHASAMLEWFRQHHRTDLRPFSGVNYRWEVGT